jgi:multidrug efflux system membrane fusion protein
MDHLEGSLAMDAAGRSKRSRKQIVIAAIIIAIAVGLLAYLLLNASTTSEDATVDAEVVHIAAVVGGRITDLPIKENDLVKRGDLLFKVDPVAYQNAVEQAEANVEVAQAALAAQKRALATQTSSALIATEQRQRAETNLGLAERSEKRLRPLAEKGYVPLQQHDQSQIALLGAQTSLRQAQEQEIAAKNAIGTLDSATAALRAAQAALANAQRALESTEVIAPHNGRVTGLSVSTGEVIMPSQSLFTLVNTEEWFAVANLRETELKNITEGDCATVFSMIDRRTALKGVVQSIGWGVLSDDSIKLPRSVPYIKASLNWVHVAQRFPVRIHIIDPPEGMLRLGASAIVEMKHGAACR